jgi:hypothetical protein
MRVKDPHAGGTVVAIVINNAINVGRRSVNRWDDTALPEGSEFSGHWRNPVITIIAVAVPVAFQLKVDIPWGE